METPAEGTRGGNPSSRVEGGSRVESPARVETNRGNTNDGWRRFENRELKEGMSFEVVESAARLVNSLLLEKAALRSKNPAVRKKLNHDYHTDSLAIVTGNGIRLRAA